MDSRLVLMLVISLVTVYAWRFTTNVVVRFGSLLKVDLIRLGDEIRLLSLHCKVAGKYATKQVEAEWDQFCADLWNGLVYTGKLIVTTVVTYSKRLAESVHIAYVHMKVGYSSLIDMTETSSVILAKKLSSADISHIATTIVMPELIKTQEGKDRLLGYMLLANPHVELCVGEGVIGLRNDGYFHVLRSYLNHKVNVEEPVIPTAEEEVAEVISEAEKRILAEKLALNLLHGKTEDDEADDEENVYSQALCIYMGVVSPTVTVEMYQEFEKAMAKHYKLDSPQWLTSEQVMRFCRQIMVAANIDFSEEVLEKNVVDMLNPIFDVPVCKSILPDIDNSDKPAFLRFVTDDEPIKTFSVDKPGAFVFKKLSEEFDENDNWSFVNGDIKEEAKEEAAVTTTDQDK